MADTYMLRNDLNDLKRYLNQLEERIEELEQEPTPPSAKDVWGTLKEIETGGGCTAWCYTLHAGCYVLFTEEAGMSVPVPGQEVEVGFYDNNDEQRIICKSIRFEDIRGFCAFLANMSGRA